VTNIFILNISLLRIRTVRNKEHEFVPRNGTLPSKVYIRTPLIWINWDGKPSGYAENPDN